MLTVTSSCPQIMPALARQVCCRGAVPKDSELLRAVFYHLFGRGVSMPWGLRFGAVLPRGNFNQTVFRVQGLYLLFAFAHADWPKICWGPLALNLSFQPDEQSCNTDSCVLSHRATTSLSLCDPRPNCDRSLSVSRVSQLRDVTDKCVRDTAVYNQSQGSEALVSRRCAICKSITGSGLGPTCC